MGKVLDTFTGAGDAKQAAKKAANMAQWQDFSSNTPFGSGSLTRSGGLNFGGGPGASLTGMFQNLGAQFGAQAGAAPTGQVNWDPNAVAAQGAGTGAASKALFANAGTPFLQAGQNYANSLNQFNPDQFAQTQYDRLTNLAKPGEETQTRSMLQNLFSKGRLGAGDTAGSRAIGELEKAQLQAADSRALQSVGMAQQEAQSRAGIAGQMAGAGGSLFGQGEALASSELGRFLSSLQGGLQVGSFQNDLATSLLQRALGSTGGISAALAPSNQGIQNLIAAGSATNTGGQAAGALYGAGGNAAAGATGNFFGSLFGALG